jgi:hypothetical protein
MSLKASISEVDWDGSVALAYAAEQLFAAAQLLTSDRIPADQALRASCEQHISALLEYREFLPPVLATELEAAHSICTEKITSAIRKEDVQQLSVRVMELLRNISRVLNQVEPGAPLAA